tara:strand:- start:1336 stop:1593 length:258 start_codon:yes stop_codon:yes gene_type:complete
MFQVLSLAGTAIGVIWYISNIINDLKSDLSKSNQLNEIQERKIESLENMITKNYGLCRDGRVKIWEDLNALKLKVAKIEGRSDDK